MTAQFLDTLFLGLVTYLGHSTIFLTLGLLATALPFMKNINLKETILRTALFGALLTTPLHLSGAFETLSDPISLPKKTLQSEPVSLNSDHTGVEQTLPATSQVTTAPSGPEEKAAGSLIPQIEPAAQDSGQPSILTLANIVLLIWALLGSALLVQLGYLVIGLKIQISGRRTLHSGRAVSFAKRLAKEAGIPTPSISTKENLAGPFCLGTGEILIPEWAETLPHSQLKAMIAHEIAHIKRADPYWVLAARIVQSVFFFQPLNIMAARKLSELSEFACDAWAGKMCGSGMPLAECLAECAKRHLGKAPSALGAAMAHKRSPIVERTHALLSGLKDYAKPASRVSKIAVIGTFVVGASMIPVFAFDEDDESVFFDDTMSFGNADDDGDRAFFSNDDFISSDDGFGFDMAADLADVAEPADVTFFAEPTPEVAETVSGAAVVVDEIAPVEPEGDLVFEEMAEAAPVLTASNDSSDSSSSYIISDDDGTMEIKVSYSDDDHQLKIRAEGKFRFNDEETAMAEMSRDSYLDITETTDNYKRRVRYEDNGRGISETYWLNGKEITKDAATQRWVADMIPTMYRQTGIDAEKRAKRIFERDGVKGVLNETSLIKGSYGRRVYASVLTGMAQLSDGESKRFMEIAGGISGSYDLRETLTAYAKNQTLSDAEWGYFVKAAQNVSGSYDLRETLTQAAQDFKGPRENWRYLLETASGISSDYDLRETLISFKKSMPRDDETIEQLAAVAQHISGSYDLRETLSSFIEEGGFGEKGWMALLETTGQISGGYDKRSTLEVFAKEMPRSEALVAKYREIANSISGGYDREQALNAID